MARRGIIIYKAIALRFLFVLHISLCLWRVYEEFNQQLGWWLIFGSSVLLLSIEAAVTICCNKQGEWTTFVPSIFIYLMGTIPTLCMIEWEMFKRRLQYENNFGICPEYAANTTNVNISNGVGKGSYEWSLALQQCLVILLVAGRWFLPSAKVSRENVFCLLLAYIGMSSDLLQFLSAGTQSEHVRCDKSVILPILCLWAISLLQFAFKLNFTVREQSRSLTHIHETLYQRFSYQGWGIIFAILMQDGPFLVMRLYLIANYRLLNQGLVFFTFKNILVLLLQLHRIWILLCYTWDPIEGKFTSKLIIRLRGNTKIAAYYGYENTKPRLAMRQDMDNRGFEMPIADYSTSTGISSRPSYETYESSSRRVPDGESRSSNEFQLDDGPQSYQRQVPHPAEQLWMVPRDPRDQSTQQQMHMIPRVTSQLVDQNKQGPSFNSRVAKGKFFSGKKQRPPPLPVEPPPLEENDNWQLMKRGQTPSSSVHDQHDQESLNRSRPGSGRPRNTSWSSKRDAPLY